MAIDSSGATRLQDYDISVIVPVYNDGKYIGEAIESVLSQSINPFEIIVVDDGSTDDSAATARRFSNRVRLIRQTNRGAAAARNTGISAATGNYLGFLDADDLWLPNKLELQIAAMELNPALDMVFGYLEHFHSSDLSPELRHKLHCPEVPLPCRTAVAMLIKRLAFERVGNFNENCGVGEVIEWYGRAREHNLLQEMLAPVLVRRRIHAENTGVLRREEYGYTEILKAMLDRKKQRSME
ncbi:MAG: glycosyltransferase involved in cell wall biosynthesis [Alcanivorax sp.]|jgi:glycosyltransferase involved in cell wall biosynthesis